MRTISNRKSFLIFIKTHLSEISAQLNWTWPWSLSLVEWMERDGHVQLMVGSFISKYLVVVVLFCLIQVVLLGTQIITLYTWIQIKYTFYRHRAFNNQVQVKRQQLIKVTQCGFKFSEMKLFSKVYLWMTSNIIYLAA